MMRKKKALLDRHLGQAALKDEVCKRLMTVSGVGPIVSLSFKASVDDPNRFKNSKAVAAHFGLTRVSTNQASSIDRATSASAGTS